MTDYQEVVDRAFSVKRDTLKDITECIEALYPLSAKSNSIAMELVAQLLQRKQDEMRKKGMIQ
jgi:hypothetical protein